MVLCEELLLVILVFLFRSFCAGYSLISLDAEVLEFLLIWTSGGESESMVQQCRSNLPNFLHVLGKFNGMKLNFRKDLGYSRSGDGAGLSAWCLVHV